MLIKILKNKVVVISSLVVLCLVSFIGVYLYSEDKRNSKNKIVSNTDKILNKEMVVTKVEDDITVEIKGQVVNPGVYRIKEGLRVIDVVNLAGGLTDSANTRYINLSKKVTDEMSIIIYSNDEINKNKESNIVIIEEPCVCSPIKNDACLKDVNDNNLISINSSSKEELLKIPGIGEAKANAIIQYRKDKKFNSIEDIMNVKGIGQSLFDAIKEYIKI